MGRSVSLPFVVLCFLAGCGDPPALIVDLRSDLRPGVEIFSTRVHLARPGDGDRDPEIHALETGHDLLSGARIAEFENVPPGTWTVTVEVRGAQGRALQERVIIVDLVEDSQAVTAIITRDCANITCPASGDDPSLVACLGGACVDERCTPQTPEHCPDAECMMDEDCTPASSCSTPICSQGLCLERPDDSLCESGMCDPSRGCLLEGLSMIDSGVYHSCGIRSATSDVVCWGLGDAGQRGDGSVVDSSWGEPVTGLTGAISLALGYHHSCALTNTGEVTCWGQNDRGQLGSGDLVARLQPESAIDTLSNIVHIASSYDHTCAVDSGGEAYCWGWNGAGQLGIGTLSDSNVPALVVTGTSGGFATVATGFEHSCATSSAGEVYCWGRNGLGQLGQAGTADSGVPLLVMGLSDIAQVVTGYEHSCARANNGLAYCWGSNTGGQLGWPAVGVTVSSDRGQLPMTDVLDISAGFGHSCAIVNESSRQVQCWGRNQRGQLGDGTTTQRTGSTQVVDVFQSEQISLGFEHSCTLSTSGRVQCWGRNDFGQIGEGGTGDQTRAVMVLGPQ